MSSDFDPYYKWLGIPPKDQPPHHYRLLGIELFEADEEVIEAAANRLMTYLHEISTGDSADQAQQLLNEISTARICLLNRQRKAAYDSQLKAKLAATENRARPALHASSRSHPSIARVVSVEQPPGKGSRPSSSLWLIGCAALLAFAAVVGTLLVVLNYDRGAGDVSKTDASGVPDTRPASRPAMLTLDWPASERSGGTVLINGVSHPVAAEGSLEFAVRAGVIR